MITLLILVNKVFLFLGIHFFCVDLGTVFIENRFVGPTIIIKAISLSINFDLNVSIICFRWWLSGLKFLRILIDSIHFLIVSTKSWNSHFMIVERQIYLQVVLNSHFFVVHFWSCFFHQFLIVMQLFVFLEFMVVDDRVVSQIEVCLFRFKFLSWWSTTIFWW